MRSFTGNPFGNIRSSGPTGRNRTYHEYGDVPWYRRSNVNIGFVAVHLVTFGWVPLLVWTCINLLTGDVYCAQTGEDGNLRTWSFAAKVIAIGCLMISVAIFVGMLTSARN